MTSRSRLASLVLRCCTTLGVMAALPACDSNSSATEVKSWDAQGEIKSIADDKSSAKIAHEEIEGFMEAMTMQFKFDKPTMADSLKPGDKVSFTFVGGPAGQLIIKSITVSDATE